MRTARADSQIVEEFGQRDVRSPHGRWTTCGHVASVPAVITLRVYSHLWPGDEDRTRSVMDSVLEILRTGHGPADHAEGISAGQTA